MVNSAPTPAPRPSPGVPSTLHVHNTPRLAIRRKIVVLYTIERPPIAPRSLPFPAPFTGPRANQGRWRFERPQAKSRQHTESVLEQHAEPSAKAKRNGARKRAT